MRIVITQALSLRVILGPEISGNVPDRLERCGNHVGKSARSHGLGGYLIFHQVPISSRGFYQYLFILREGLSGKFPPISALCYFVFFILFVGFTVRLCNLIKDWWEMRNFESSSQLVKLLSQLLCNNWLSFNKNHINWLIESFIVIH